MSTTPSSQRPPIRRVVTGHTAEGKAIVVDDVAIHPRPFGGPSTSLIADVFWTDSFPSDNSGEFKDTTKEHVKDFLSPNGTVFRVVDIPPGGVSPFHRTVSLDYAILTSGTLTCILDDNKRVSLKTGDVIVQRGTIHAWSNEGNDWVRMYCIQLPAEKVKIELNAEFRPPPKA